MDIETHTDSPSQRAESTPPPPAAGALRFPFQYIDDPVCVASMLIYVLNRFVLKPQHIGGWLVHDYLNDLLCLPIFLPIILRLQSVLGIRRHHLPPTMLELMHNWLVFSVLYYFVFPRSPWFASMADPWNSVAYLFGGVVTYLFWRWFYASDMAWRLVTSVRAKVAFRWKT